MAVLWSLRAALAGDAQWMAELRALVMRPDLERLGRWSETRVRTRFLDAYRPEFTWVIVVDGRDAGLISVRPEPDAQWIEHFYLASAFHGRGIGGEVLVHVMNLTRDARPFRIDVMQGSPARRLYERNGFVFDSEDAIDVYLSAS